MSDQYAANLSALLHCDGANAATSSPDSSRWQSALACKGTAVISTTQKQFGSASLKTGNTNGNYGLLGNAPQFNFGSGDLTVEAFVWPVSQGADGGAIIGRWDSSGANTDWLIWRGANGEVNVSLNGTQVITGASGDLPTGAFAHVALTRQGTALQVWVGGVAKGSATFSGAINCTLGLPVVLGQSNLAAAATWLEAYYDEVRVTKGVARYTAAFTPAATAFDPYPVDAYAANVVLDLRMDGDNASTTITDQAGHTVTLNGAPKLSTVQAVLGGSSLLLNGSTDYLSLASSSDFDVGTGDYTVEAWIWMSSTLTGESDIISKNSSGTAGWLTMYRSNGTQVIIFAHSYNSAGSQVTVQSPTLNVQQWHHIAVCKIGLTLTMYVNGAPVATAALSNTAVTLNTNPVRVGANGGAASMWNGYLDGIRVTKGVGRYTALFDPLALTTVPSAALGVLRGSRTVMAQGLVTPVVSRKGPAIPYGSSRLLDYTWGGTASVSGKVTINTVAAVRRVFLIDLKSMLVIRSAWSDASGNYSFANIDGNRNYMVIGRDYQQIYNAVVQDLITPATTAPAAFRPARRKLRFKAGGTGLSTNYPALIRVGESTPNGVATAQAVTNADVICPVRYMPRTRDDVTDIVFTDTSGNQLDFWMEGVYGTAPDRVAYYWVKLPGDLDAGPVDIYVQYNRGLTQTKTSSGAGLPWTLFDDFAAYDSSKWQVDSGISTSTGVFTNSAWSLQASSTEGGVRSVTAFAAGLEALAVYTQFGYNSTAGAVQNQFGFVSGTGALNTVATLENVGDYQTGSRLAIGGEATTNTNGRFTPTVGGGSATSGVPTPTAQAGRIALGRGSDGSVALQINNQTVMTHSGAGTGNANLAIYRGKSSQSGYVSLIDWVALRKYIPSGPPAMLQFAEEFL
ncbi:DUF2341 domain-containing protein [Cupriavidus sp. YAF13]|uniref:DUF2341 domain-containing protein n=1 Tax=Cupriavidus sp. YAF13 TaxID=3233075 RepID=UPI003F906534